MMKKNLFMNGLALFVCLFLFAGASFAQTQTVVAQVKTSGTWTVPEDVHVTSVTFEAWGGGGAGGYSWTPFWITPAGGGGGGAYAKSATITDVQAGEHFYIAIGEGGTAVGTDLNHYQVTDGGTTAVERENGETMMVLAVGGKSVQGVSTQTGATGGNMNECIGAVRYSGGNGGNADKGLLESGAWCVSGSGGGAGGRIGNGGNANNSTYNANPLNTSIPFGQTVGTPGQGNGGFAGNGASGRKSQIYGDGGWGNAQGTDGGKYGGGGSGAISNGVSWGDANGGQGGDGIVVITYTYLSETIEVADVDQYICSKSCLTCYTPFSIPLDVDVFGFQLKDAHLSLSSYDNETGLSIGPSPSFSYDNTEGKWYVNGAFRNTTTNTLSLTIHGIAQTSNNVSNDEFTVTLHIYPRVDGGLIAIDQYVCADQTIDVLKGDGSVVTDPNFGTLTTAKGSGGSGNGHYQWLALNMLDPDATYEAIPGANSENYTPSNGYYTFKRVYRDEVCGRSYAMNAYWTDDNYIEVITVNPVVLYETGFSEDTICSNESYTNVLSFYGTSPAADWYKGYYLQVSYDKGSQWDNVTYVSSGSSTISLTPSDFSPGDDIWYRFGILFFNCDPLPSNGILKIHVKEVPDYTDQFEDVNITLWYGACDTSIANLTAPTLTPEPVSITRVDNLDRVGVEPGEYTITWSVIADDCNIPVEYDQTVTVEYPKCGTLEEPYTITDLDGYEYNTIRIGCDCWLAENLRTNAANATYYDEDDANMAFGKLYDWNDAVGSNNEELDTKLGTTYIQGVCPFGWAMPTVAQYNTMMSNVDGVDAIKSDDQETWLPGNAGTNASGFAAMGAGYYESLQYQRMLGYTYFWTADLNESNNTVAKVMELRCGCDELTCTEKNKESKVSVRCVKVEPDIFICGLSKMRDADGNEYETVEIGTQCWSKSNLRTTTYANNTAIATTDYFTDPQAVNSEYGYLYKWEAASNAAGLCPKGWHAGTKEDWQTLRASVSSNKDLASNSGWLTSTNTAMIGYDQENTNNSTGFTAYPAGQFNATSYQSESRIGTFWTTTEVEGNTSSAWCYVLNATNNTGMSSGFKTWGRSIRCIKD